MVFLNKFTTYEEAETATIGPVVETTGIGVVETGPGPLRSVFIPPFYYCVGIDSETNRYKWYNAYDEDDIIETVDENPDVENGFDLYYLDGSSWQIYSVSGGEFSVMTESINRRDLARYKEPWIGYVRGLSHIMYNKEQKLEQIIQPAL